MSLILTSSSVEGRRFVSHPAASCYIDTMDATERKNKARQELVDIFEDSKAMPGNEQAFEDALREYTAAVVAHVLFDVERFQPTARNAARNAGRGGRRTSRHATREVVD